MFFSVLSIPSDTAGLENYPQLNTSKELDELGLFRLGGEPVDHLFCAIDPVDSSESYYRSTQYEIPGGFGCGRIVCLQRMTQKKVSIGVAFSTLEGEPLPVLGLSDLESSALGSPATVLFSEERSPRNLLCAFASSTSDYVKYWTTVMGIRETAEGILFLSQLLHPSPKEKAPTAKLSALELLPDAKSQLIVPVARAATGYVHGIHNVVGVTKIN